MANQKVTARVALTSGQLNPVLDVLPIVDVSAGASGSKKITINALFTGWGFTAAGEALAKAATTQAQREAIGTNVSYTKSLTGLIGGGATNLDGLTTVGLAVGTLILMNISGNLTFYELIASNLAESLPYRVRPNDYDGATNMKVWSSAGLQQAGVGGTASLNIGDDLFLKANQLTNEHEQQFSDTDGNIPVVPPYADLTAANAALDPGVFFWNLALNKLQVTTA